jgi:hypothetical protein
MERVAGAGHLEAKGGARGQGWERLREIGCNEGSV